MQDDGLYAAMVRRGMTRRSFLQFSAAMAAALALPASFAPQIAQAVEASKRLPVIWVRGQACGGDTEALLRMADPDTVALFLDVLNVQYHESFLAVAGADAEAARTDAMARYPNGYLAVIEGSIPDGASGAYCLIGGRPAAEVVREVAAGALATIAVGSCACDGGAPAAGSNVTGAGGVKSMVPSGKYMALPGCPVNPVNLAAVIVHFIAYNQLPPADGASRPLSVYGDLIHNQCERRPHFEFGEFATEWGDEGAQRGWCLYKLGCKGPETMGNCPTVRYGQKTSWNVGSGAGCIGCMTTSFWNEMGSAYKRLPAPVPALPNMTVDNLGQVMMVGLTGVIGVHAVGMGVRFKRRRMIAAHERAAGVGAPAAVPDAAVAVESAPASAPAASVAGHPPELEQAADLERGQQSPDPVAEAVGSRLDVAEPETERSVAEPEPEPEPEPATGVADAAAPAEPEER